MDPDTADQRAPGSAPVPLLVAAAVVVLQGVGAFVFGVFEAFTFSTARAALVVTTSVFFVIVGIGLLVCARELVRLRSWARGPVMLAQLMSLGLAWNFRGGETTWISVVLAVPGLIGLVAMLQPATVQALNESD